MKFKLTNPNQKLITLAKIVNTTYDPKKKSIIFKVDEKIQEKKEYEGLTYKKASEKSIIEFKKEWKQLFKGKSIKVEFPNTTKEMMTVDDPKWSKENYTFPYMSYSAKLLFENEPKNLSQEKLEQLTKEQGMTYFNLKKIIGKYAFARNAIRPDGSIQIIGIEEHLTTTGERNKIEYELPLKLTTEANKFLKEMVQYSTFKIQFDKFNKAHRTI